MSDTAIVILAAGSSSRLGRSKQLLAFQNATLVERIVAEAVAAEFLTIVVTGSNAEEVSLALKNKEVTIVYNFDWQEGMATGIVAGVSKALELNRQLQNIIAAVCDQPFVTAELFKELQNIKAKTGKGIVACAYADTIGTPVLFDHNYFKSLKDLKGNDGAKSLLKMFKHDVATVSFPKGSIDIDTEEDYNNLLKHEP